MVARSIVNSWCLIGALLLLTPLAYAQQDWRSDLQPHQKYFPEHEDHLRREWNVRQRLQTEQPVAMRKFSTDAGQKFFLDYWIFEQASQDVEQSGSLNDDDNLTHRDPTQAMSTNATEALLLAPFWLHSDFHRSSISRYFRRDIYQRSFQCPAGTTNCSSIGQPNSCCQNNEVCVSVQSSPVGPVGCCPSGETCNGKVASCDAAQGYTSCPYSPNGGCCIPGYACKDVGCILTGTVTTITSLPVSTVTSGMTPITNLPPSSSSTTSQRVTVVIPATVNTVQTVTTTVVLSPSTSAVPTTIVRTITVTQSTSSLSCTVGYQSCPASLGGGCCPTNRACGSPTCPPLSTASSTASAVAPVRPTSLSSSSPKSSSISTTTTPAVSVSGCPTGFYMCSAYYMGGCCQVDRNCDTTSCPPRGSAVVVTSTSITIVAASPTSSAAGQQGNCNSGWFACASADGGGCCPSGFLCGASCTATIGGQSNVGKQAPSMATKHRIAGWGLLSLGIGSGLVMFLL